MAEFLFHVPLRGNLFLLFFCSLLFVTGALSMGLLISVSTKSQLQANQLAMLTTFMPSFLLSGFIYAIRNMPGPIQAVTHIVPARYFISILRAIYLKGVGLEVLAVDVGLLGLFCVVMVVLATRKFRKSLD
jgi:ABC-2 type transport system permease protein